MSARWIDQDVLAIVDTASTFLTPTKINRVGSSAANVVRVYNAGSNPVFYNFSGDQNPPTPPIPASSIGIPIASGADPIDIDGFDNLQNLQFICASGLSSTLFVLYGSE